MNTSIELIIPCDKKSNIIAFIISPFIAAVSLFLLVSVSTNYYDSGYSSVVLFLMKILLSITFVISILIFICIPFQKINVPNAILNQDGIWIKHYGFIPWKDIKEIAKYTYGTPIEIVGIQVKYPDLLSKQASFGGKCGIFWSKIFGYYHISIGSPEITSDEILYFANKYITDISHPLL